MKFTKYHALGNDYLVIDPKDLGRQITGSDIKTLCDRHYGIGADGVLFGPLQSKHQDFLLRIFNPDASEAEKSGNGLRIFSRYLFDCGLVNNNTFSIETRGGTVYASVHGGGASISVDMGKVTFSHGKGSANQLLAEESTAELSVDSIIANNKTFPFYRANVGNPHCVIPVEALSASKAKIYGPSIATDSRFVNQTNVQFMQVIDRKTIAIEIWERGAGYTLASGSSSTAAAAVAFRLGLCDAEISVQMPGGVIEISFKDKFHATMTGPVCKIAAGELAQEAMPTSCTAPQ